MTTATTQDFSQLKVGDKLTRYLGGSVPMPVTVTSITEDRIKCGPWEFSRKNGFEIDADLGWDETNTGTYLRHPRK